MNWLDQYQFFLFDFDGLLVDTEKLHYEAFREALTFYGVEFHWDYLSYCQVAHSSSESLKDRIPKEFPQIKEKVSSWEELYIKKGEILTALLRKMAPSLMAGVEEFLQILKQKGAVSAVVTNSSREFVEKIKELYPILKTISLWLTREFYSNPKPHPDSYLIALERLNGSKKMAIGFEDSPRGIEALKRAEIEPIWISEVPYLEIDSYVEQGGRYCSSFEELLSRS